MKKLYMWDDVDDLTRSYHSDGALVIVSDLEAEEAFKKAIEDGHFFEKAVYDEPDRSFEVDAEVNEVFVYPNSGCC